MPRYLVINQCIRPNNTFDMVKALNENKMVIKTIIIQFKIIMFEPTFMVIHLNVLQQSNDLQSHSDNLLGTMNICTKVQARPSDSCLDISSRKCMFSNLGFWTSFRLSPQMTQSKALLINPISSAGIISRIDVDHRPPHYCCIH